MRALDLSPILLLALGALAGAAGGIGAARLCDWLPPRYEVTQVATGAARVRRNTGVILIVIGVGVWLAHLTAAAPSTSLERAAFYFATNLGISLAVVAAAAIDLEHMILPNELTFGAAAIALATSYWRAVGLRGALLGAVVGLALTCLPALLYKKLRRRSGAGVGDAKLVAVAGLWFGAPGAIFVVFASSVQSAVFAVAMRLLGRTIQVPASVHTELAALRARAEAGDVEARGVLDDDPMAAEVGAGELATMRLPMGPFLVLACLELLLARTYIFALLDRLLTSP